MRLVESILRPARIAWVLPAQPSSIAANRTFRLATARWGGRYDIIVQHDVTEALSDFAASALALADPDFVFSVDRTLGRHDWKPQLAALRIQPFETAHVARDATAVEWASLLHGRPTVGDDEPTPCRAATGTAFDWRTAARRGLLDSDGRALQAADDDSLPTAVEASSEGLTHRATLGIWLLLGDPCLEIACRYWTLRALGARVVWRGVAMIGTDRRLTTRDRQLLAHTYLSAPALSDDDVMAQLKVHGIKRARVGNEDLRTYSGKTPEGCEYARQALAVAPHRGRLHFSLPAPDTKGRPLSGIVVGVVEHRLRSLDPTSPDGIMLSADDFTRKLLGQGQLRADLRVTGHGIASQKSLAQASLQSVPMIGFRDAVAAPLQAAGFSVELSDKGRFQTKALEQAQGLRFLAWALCETESRHLLELFDQHHLPGMKLKPSARRSVTYADLRDRLFALLKTDQRLTAARRAQAEAWLRRWADQLLDRGMLVGGFHLKCEECLFGEFYGAERTDARFRCDRCTAVGVVPADAEWRLRLGELFDTLRRQHGDVVTLVLAWLREQAAESLLYLPEVNLLRAGDLFSEADFAALVDGRLAIGEAKSTRSMSQKEISKLARAARLAGASRLIFATLSHDPACGTPLCAGCAEDGEPHPDHAWDVGTRHRIRAVRTQLLPHGIDTISLCRADLLVAPAARLGELADATKAFEPLRRRP